MLLEHTLVKRVEFANEDITRDNIELEINLSRNFNCISDRKGLLELFLEIKDKEAKSADTFKLSVEMNSFFSLDDEEDVLEHMEDIGDEAANMAYPYLVTYVSAFLPLAGFPALFLPTTLRSF